MTAHRYLSPVYQRKLPADVERDLAKLDRAPGKWVPLLQDDNPSVAAEERERYVGLFRRRSIDTYEFTARGDTLYGKFEDR